MNEGKLGMGGDLGIKVCRIAKPVGIGWKLRNLRNLLRGLPGVLLAKAGEPFGLMAGVGRLHMRVHKADGSWVNYGLVGTRVVTTAFVSFVVDQLQTETSVFGDFKYHDSGTGTTAENAADTSMETAVTDNLRAVGTQTESSATVYASVGTIAYTGAHAITEHGLFNNTRASGGTLMDRTVFAAVNVANGDSIEFTYSLTVSAGG